MNDGSDSTTPIADLAAPEGSGELEALRRLMADRPGDRRVPLRLAHLLLLRGERASGRALLTPLERGLDAVAAAAARELARLDDAEGLREQAASRWERLLADDVDDPEAQSRVPGRTNPADAASGSAESRPIVTPTLFTPAGVSTGRYELLEELGRGATATVFLARDPALDRLVALKVLHPGFVAAAGGATRERFLAEARLAASLRHPGVIAIYDLDEATGALAMELVAGGTLRERLRRQAPAAAEVHAMAHGLLSTLAYLHARGVVHGDLTPRNLLLRPDGSVVITDFGAARLLRAGAEASASGPAGTPLYVAPEQLRGASSSAASDLFSVGAILWEMLAGRPMRTHADLLTSGPKAPPLPKPTRDAPESAAVAELTERLCRTEPRERPSDAATALQWLSDATAASQAERPA